MKNNYAIRKIVRREEIIIKGTRIFEEMFNILEYKFGNINKDDCYWLINQDDFSNIYYEMMGFGIERNANRVTINGIDVLFTDDLIVEKEYPLSYRIELVYKKPILHHIYANNNPFLSSRYMFLNDIPEVKKVIFNDPATIIYWKDGTKTVVKCQAGDVFDSEKGFAMAFLKKCWGNTGNFNDKLIKIIKEAK